MQILFTVLALLSFSNANAAVCSRTLTFADGSVLTASQLNAEFNAITNCANSLNDDNLSSSAGILPSKISAIIAGDGLARDGTTGALSVGVDDTTIEINSDELRVKDNSITTAKIVDANVTRAKIASDVTVSLVPTAAVLPYAGTSLPSGFLWADGTAVSRVTYSALFTAIGITHGQGDGTSTFNVPDYRGRFLRGVDGSAGRDPNEGTRTAMAAGGNTGDNVGSLQTSMVGPHAHTIDMISTAGGAPNGGYGVFNINAGNAGNYSLSGDTFSASVTETRPINASVNYIIKY